MTGILDFKRNIDKYGFVMQTDSCMDCNFKLKGYAQLGAEYVYVNKFELHFTCSLIINLLTDKFCGAIFISFCGQIIWPFLWANIYVLCGSIFMYFVAQYLCLFVSQCLFLFSSQYFFFLWANVSVFLWINIYVFLLANINLSIYKNINGNLMASLLESIIFFHYRCTNTM